MQEHNLFKPKSFEEGKNAVVGNCNGITMQDRWKAETPAFAKKILHFAKREAEILDYGCGVGRIAKEILNQNPTVWVTGIDASQNMLIQAFDYVQTNRFLGILPEQIRDQKFDIAYCVYVLQHVPAIEIREILSRIYSHLKDDGFFIYCSSNYRMAIRFDGKGFFDDRFLGVNLQEEIERFFDEYQPLFIPEELEGNPVLKKMITGCDGGLEHPAFVYKKKKVLTQVTKVLEPPVEVKKDEPINIEVSITKPQKLLFINRLSPGDVLVMTNAIRDLHLAHPGKFITDVRTPCPDIFANNPYITKLTYNEAEYNQINTWFQSHVGQTKMLGDIMCIDMQYPLIHQSGARGSHFSEGHREFLEQTLKIKISQTKIRPEIYLTDPEKNRTNHKWLRFLEDKKYWVINAGSKSDYTLKQYPYYQEVVNLLKDEITLVQIGVKSHIHKPLDGVIDLVGKTDNLRDLFSLIYNAEGVITCVSLPMHVAAAFKKPCVVVAGAREGTRWELYPNHRFIYVNGCLPCAEYDGCWRSKIEDCNNKKDGVPKCMSLIYPEDVAHEVLRYYSGGVLKYDIKEPVILNLKGEDKVDKPEDKVDKPEDIKIATKEVDAMYPPILSKTNKDIIYEPFPVGVAHPQVTSSIFNILRILKQITPADTYLESYQWHYDKRKETFMDVYHFMNWLGTFIRPKRILEIGTRTGISICQLLSAYLNYNDLEKVILCDLFNDGLSTPGVIVNALKYLNIPVDKVQFIMGNSLEEIPKLKDTFGYILVDGGHEKETARKDLENSVQLIEPGGYILMDDITEDGCSLQDVWDEFKQNNFQNFIFMENHDGKGIGVAKRI
jgi:ADP-heptose:LPS heptosyltransferase/SAM-dependent methyltransferase